MEHFIIKIQIDKLRHLSNIEISLKEKERQHLLITGKNGSGKTTLLLALKQYLSAINDSRLDDIKHFYYIVNNNFFKEGSNLNRSFIYVQEEDKNVIFNPLSNKNDEVTKNNENKILKLYRELKNDYHLSVRPYERYKEDGSKELIP